MLNAGRRGPGLGWVRAVRLLAARRIYGRVGHTGDCLCVLRHILIFTLYTYRYYDYLSHPISLAVSAVGMHS